ncbi:zinc finger protein 853 [Anastrepha ludens]|uniref:zinc finger protein 853 n=1 Tax=Anastrepha ludens TaxID=28586 RepID=UPI0023B09D54|nr:zinc finger protein 853 [Anastrepha ludens]XP_053963912.1 zinc finger protein 853 [Anastrepha ludens]
MERKKVLELDKICRVCIAERKDMRPLFSEKIAEMLMECASVNIEDTEGWPDKICIQCVHSVSRCHAFKKLVERSDKELREYIKSLTVRVVIEDSSDVKMEQATQPKILSQKPPKLQLIQPQTQFQLQTQHNQLQLQQQQLILQQQQQQQNQQQQQQQNQQQQQQQQQQLQQIQHLQLQPQQPAKRKAISTARKSQRQSKKPHLLPQPVQQQHQHQQTLEQVSLQTMVSNVTPTRTQAQSANQHLQTAQGTLQTQPQPQQLISTAALPPQIVLPNGQILTTAQIVTHAGPPQIAQIISTANGSAVQTNPATTTVTAQPQFTPQIIQTSSGQTLHLIQQPNGQQTLQLVQVLPQRTLATTVNGASVMVTTAEDGTTTIVDDDALITPDEHHLIDADDGDLEEEDEQICETIVVEDDQLTHQQLLAGHHTIVDEDNLSQGETQELEYLEDVTVTTSNAGHSQHHQHHTQHYQQLSDCDGDASQQHHIQLHDEDDIIEEIHMEEEELLEDDGADVMHVMESDGREFISDEDVSQQQLIGENGDPLQYTVMEAGTDDDELVETDVKEVLQAACGPDMHTVVDFNQTVNNVSSGTVSVGGASVGSQTPTPKRQRKSNSKAVANSRQLVATASSIATSGAADDFEIDPKLIAEFISQQTSMLGSGRHVCNLCRHEFKQFKALHNHMHQHSNWIRANCKKQPQCEICSKSFKGPGMLKMHMKTHQSAARTPTCNICNKSFKSKAILYRHRQTHQLRSYACAVDNCRKTFSMPQTLRTHADNKHPNSQQPKFKCGECGIHFEDVDMLHTHVQAGVHSGTVTIENGSGGGGHNDEPGGSVGGSIDGTGCMDGSMTGNTIIVVTQG